MNVANCNDEGGRLFCIRVIQIRIGISDTVGRENQRDNFVIRTGPQD